MPCVITEITNDGLHNQPRQRCRNPKHWNFVFTRPEGLKNARHVSSLEGEPKLDPQEAEAHVPDFPKSKIALFHDFLIDAWGWRCTVGFVCNIH